MQPVSISFLKWNVGPYPMYLIVAGSFGAGILLMLIFTALEFLRARLMIRHLERKISKLTREIEKKTIEHG